jgi:hypothetical protein
MRTKLGFSMYYKIFIGCAYLFIIAIVAQYYTFSFNNVLQDLSVVFAIATTVVLFAIAVASIYAYIKMKQTEDENERGKLLKRFKMIFAGHYSPESKTGKLFVPLFFLKNLAKALTMIGYYSSVNF